MTPINEVRAWWDSLTREERRDEALNMLGTIDSFDSWDVEWDHLSASRQQVRLRFYYDGGLVSSRGAVLAPIHKLAQASWIKGPGGNLRY
jgi:hypothetical protein